jgi:inosine-uridine nucleoside N-ribohydrolase
MNKLLSTLLLVLLSLSVGAQQKSAIKPRVLISTDIGGTDPDDNQSVTHLLMYSNEFDLEGLVSSPSFGDGSAKEIYRMIDVYEQDFKTLRQHNKALMEPNALRKLVRQGRQSEMPACGYGEPTEGSKWIIKQARKKDSRPLYVLVWGCLEDVAQALHDAPDIASKICVHWIGGPNKK